MALDFTFLTEKQIWGNKDGKGQLDVLGRYGISVAPTDLAILFGCWTAIGHYTFEGDLCCSCWTSSPMNYGAVLSVSYEGVKDRTPPNEQQQSVRPVLPSSITAKLRPSKQWKLGCVNIVEYGEYPQTVADEQTSQELEKRYKSNSLQQTGKGYTFLERGGSFRPITSSEYKFENKKYIRVLGKPVDDYTRLSTGKIAKKKKPYWVRVEPIEWLKDKTGTWVSKKCLFSGVPFDTKKNYDGNFKNTFIKKYLDTYFAKEIIPPEWQMDIEREATMEGLNKKLAEISDLEKIKMTVMPSRTPERTETLARIMRVRKAKAILSAAAQKAHKEGDEVLLQKIIEIAKPYAAREAVVLDKFHQRQAARRAKAGRE